MKRSIKAGVILLAVYPAAAGILILLERRGLSAWSMSHIMTLRLLAGLASFVGVAILVAEYQSRKHMSRLDKTELPNNTPEDIRR